MKTSRCRIILCVAAAMIFQLILAAGRNVGQAQTAPVQLPAGHYLTNLVKTGIINSTAADARVLDTTTRAEMATLLVRALDREIDAQFIVGPYPFPDIDQHWARGHIAIAHLAGLMNGYSDGSFRPNLPITQVEVLTALLRLVGHEPTAGKWPDSIIEAASRLGITPWSLINPAINAAKPAARLFVFEALYLTMTKVSAAPDGQTLWQQQNRLPLTLTIDPLPGHTAPGPLQLRGTVSNHAAITINDQPLPPATNQFAYRLDIAPGLNVFTIKAVDGAGNSAAKTVAVTSGEPLDRLVVSGPVRLQPSETAKYFVQGYSADGQSLVLGDLTAQTEGEIGAFDAQSLVLNAAAAPAGGALVFSSQGISERHPIAIVGQAAAAHHLVLTDLNGGQPLAAGVPSTAEVEVRDAADKLLDYDEGRTVTLTAAGAGSEGLEITPAGAATRGGRAAFTVKVPTAGQLTLNIAAPGVQGATYQVEVLPPVRVLLTANPATIIGDGFDTGIITAHLVDPAGRPVPNRTGEDLLIELRTASAAGALSGRELRIPPGSDRSAGSAMLTAGSGGGITVMGRLLDKPAWPVQAVTIPVTVPGRGWAIALRASGPAQPVPAGTRIPITVQAIDGAGQVVADAEYAFRLRVSADDHGEERAESGSQMPSGVVVGTGNTDLSPALGRTVRTRNGIAQIWLESQRAGIFTVTPLPSAGTDQAYSADDRQGVALSSLGMQTVAATATVTAPIAGLKASVHSPLGVGAAGALRAGSRDIATIQVDLVDAGAYTIPDARAAVTLVPPTQGMVTVAPGLRQKQTTAGRADFAVRAGSEPGADLYQVTGPGADQTVEIWVQDRPPAAPVFAAAYRTADGALELDLDTAAEVATVRVYMAGASRPIFETPPQMLPAGRLLIRVPGYLLPTGPAGYQVTLRNAAGESPRTTILTPAGG